MPSLLALGLAAGLVVACTAGPGGAPGPTTSPRSSPITPPSPATPLPTAPAATPAEGQISHPTGPSEVVLRMDEGGGHMIYGFALTRAPTFTLYGDGTFILRQAADPERPDMAQGFARFLHGNMNEDYVQALLRHALGAGRLLDARETYAQNSCADCGTTVFTIDAAGVQKTVTIDALGLEQGGSDAADRRGFAQLRDTLLGVEARAKSGDLGEVVLYDAERYRLVLLEAFGDPLDEPLAWPWGDIAPSDFKPGAEGNYLELVVDRDDVTNVVELPTGGHPGVWVEDPGGTRWQLGVRPLLPDEIPTE